MHHDSRRTKATAAATIALMLAVSGCAGESFNFLVDDLVDADVDALDDAGETSSSETDTATSADVAGDAAVDTSETAAPDTLVDTTAPPVDTSSETDTAADTTPGDALGAGCKYCAGACPDAGTVESTCHTSCSLEGKKCKMETSGFCTCF